MSNIYNRELPEFYTSWNGERRKWTYTEEERPSPHGFCYDCDIPYKAIGDCSLPNEIWEIIKPRPQTKEWTGAGILCPNCIIERIHILGISEIKATLW